MNIANEPRSTRLPKPKNIAPYKWTSGELGIECEVGPYQVCVRWSWCGAKPFGDLTYAMLQVCRANGGSVFDWRHLQEIKNMVLGEEWEAVELFPQESRLKDPSNARYLWAVKGRLPFGLPGGRFVIDSGEGMAPQRPIAQGAADE